MNLVKCHFIAMCTKGIVVAAFILLTAQKISSSILKGNGVRTDYADKADDRVIVEIENKTYFLDTSAIGFSREDAKFLCESMNMTLVAFQTESEWLAFTTWLADTEYSYRWYWTGALQPPGGPNWYWENPYERILNFFWAPGQPDEYNIWVNSCISFNYDQGGWDDNYCTGLMHAVCEN